uniref:Uncharacterized protein n=1 Tax=Glossina brevipalpis TaxID=37001 RepID=A0A1A9W7I8_9MUSC
MTSYLQPKTNIQTNNIQPNNTERKNIQSMNIDIDIIGNTEKFTSNIEITATATKQTQNFENYSSRTREPLNNLITTSNENYTTQLYELACLSETFLQPNGIFTIKTYNVIRTDRNSNISREGGVAILISNKLTTCNDPNSMRSPSTVMIPCDCPGSKRNALHSVCIKVI